MHRVLRPLPELGRHGARSWDAIGLAAAQGVMVAPLLQIHDATVAGLALTAGRLLDPDGGDVLLDGIPLTQLRHDALRRAIGHAFARPVLVGDTVGSAIALGLQSPAAQRIRAAARAARVDTVVDRLPAGYDTRLADTPLSGGEVQRLGLARAL